MTPIDASRDARREQGRRTMALLVICAILVAGLSPTSEAGAATATTMGPAPAVPQSWVAGFHLSGHIFHSGDTITGTITVKVPGCISPVGPQYPCYKGTDWAVAGAKCKPTALVCSWKAPTAAPNSRFGIVDWTVLMLPIANPIGPAVSADYYTVVDKNTFALDGHVRDRLGNPIADVPIDIFGPENRHLTTDPTGYYSALLPRGTYTVDIPSGSIVDNRWFQPRSRTVVLNDFATADFTGADHTEVRFFKNAPGEQPVDTLVADGLDTAKVVVKYLNPLNQPVPNQALRIDTTGPMVLVCSAKPYHNGRIAPTDLINGAPLNLPFTATTDSSGTLTFQVYAGTESGTVDIAADSAANLVATDTTAFSHAGLELKPAPWVSSFPTTFNFAFTSIDGSVASENLTTLLWAQIKGKLFGNQPLIYANEIRGGAAIDQQRTLLRWVDSNNLLSTGESTSGQARALLPGVEIAPISGPGGTNPAVLFFLHGHRGDNRNTRVLDTNVFNALINAESPAAIAADLHLPTLNEWTAIVGGSTIPDYVQPAPEQGLTYNGFPYLPGADAAYSAFQTQCLPRAQ